MVLANENVEEGGVGAVLGVEIQGHLPLACLICSQMCLHGVTVVVQDVESTAPVVDGIAVEVIAVGGMAGGMSGRCAVEEERAS